MERIDSCYDSHVHWAATGEFSERLRLESLSSAADILKIPKTHLSGRDGWILGFGWNETSWPDKERLHRQLLDEWFADRPVLLTRVDAHVGWVNTAALKAVGWINAEEELLVEVPTGGRIERDQHGKISGILVDKAYEEFRSLLPKPETSDIRRHLLKATKMFHTAGFTHIRDLGGKPEHWHQALLLDRAQLLNLAVEMFFHLEHLSGLEQLCTFVEVAKRQTVTNLRAVGVKIFLDGALGSEGAWISQPYLSGSGNGLRLFTDEELTHVFKTCAARNIDVAVHAIGDAAVHQVTATARRLFEEGTPVRLHIEHAEIASPQTIEMMKGLDIFCHLQPSHWLSDRLWLKDKVGEKLYGWSFPWRRLQEAAIPFDFGSDTPIEPPSVARTFQALKESSEHGIPQLLGHPGRMMSHPDRSWAPNSYTIFENGQPTQVVFRGDHLM